MRVINEENPLIQQHKNSTGEAPLPSEYPDLISFLIAHREWLRELRKDNRRVLARNFSFVRRHKGDGTLFAFLTKIIHIRKEYDSYLVRGIDATTRHIQRGN